MSFVRENTRYPVELAVKVSCPSWEDYLELYTTNLSRGGVFIASRMSAPMGTEMTVELALPNGSSVKLRAEVVHLVGDEDAASSGRPAGMGVMFIGLDDETRKALEAMVTVARYTTKQAGSPQPIRVPPPAGAKRPPPAPAPKTAPPKPPPVEEPSLPPPPVPTEAKSRSPMFSDVVEQALFDELARRLDKRPHDQLGLEVTASEAELQDAYARLKERYHPSIFKRYGAATQEVLNKLNQLIDAAHTELVDPGKRMRAIVEARTPVAPTLSTDELETKARGEEARQRLRQGIESRVEEACRQRDLGQVDDAIRTFESVLTLDRKNEYVKKELAALRERKSDKPKGGLFDKLRGR